MTGDAAGAPTLRHDLRPGDLGTVLRMHGVLYAAEYGFNHIFESYVAETLAGLGRTYRPDRDRLWLAERDGQVVGTVAIVGREAGAAQLRWLLVRPEARGLGLGRRLVAEALDFCRAGGYASVFLWTVSALDEAARLYVSCGFRKTETLPPTRWGVEVIEERYDLALS